MPLSSNQLAALVERARLKATPVVSSSPPPKAPQRSVPPRRATPAPQTQAAARPTPKAGTTQQTEAAAVVPLPPIAAPPLPSSTPQPEATAEAADFPIGWDLKKDSWHFHRRFYAIFKRPMRHGEYSHLLWQIRRRTAEHLWEDCWRVTLPGGERTLPVRATPWRLITILPKNWQPPANCVDGTKPSLSQDPQALLQPLT